MGAHFVKTYYCEDFEHVAGTCPVPTVIAGEGRGSGLRVVGDRKCRHERRGKRGRDVQTAGHVLHHRLLRKAATV